MNLNLPLPRPRWLLLLAGIAIAMRFSTLGVSPLIDPTEGRYAQIGYTMMASGDWVVPRLDGEPFWGKPPLSFWGTALSLSVFGVNELAARLPVALAWLLTAGLAYLLAARTHGREVGLLAAVICGTVVVSYASAGVVLLDPAFAMAMALVFVALPLSVAESNPVARSAWGHAVFLGLGLSVLSKGFLALGIAGFAVGGWLVWTRSWGVVRRLPWLTGMLLALAVSVPWHVAMEMRSAGFLRYYVLGEHFERFLVPEWRSLYGESHFVPRGGIWAFWLAGNMPWLLLAGYLCYRHRGLFSRRTAAADAEGSLAVYCLCWLLAVPVLFTPARNAMETYPLPGAAPLGVLTALLVARERRSLARWPGWLTGRTALAVMVLVVPLVTAWVTFGILQDSGSRRSQKEVVAAFEKLAADAGGNLLVYPEEMPYSALFYSEGRALDRTHLDSGEVEREAANGAAVFYAIDDRDMKQYSRYGITPSHKVATIGDYGLYRDDGPDAEGSTREARGGQPAI